MQAHLAGLRETLRSWGGRVENGMDEQTFVAAARYDVLYDDAAPFWHHYRGLERYWRKRREAATAHLP